MDPKTSTDLMRLLHDELPDSQARELRRRIESEPELEREYESLALLWNGLELPEPQPAPMGFATRVVARAQESGQTGWAPAWWTHTWAGKATTALLLAGGIAFGAILASPSEAEDWSEYIAYEPSMAESYLLVMEETTESSVQENGS